MPAGRQHSWKEECFGFQCAKCLRIASTSERKKALGREYCRGHATTRLVLEDLGTYVTVHGHRLWMTGSVVRCSRCGCYTRKRIKGLSGDCPGGIPDTAHGTAWRKENLSAGRAPKAAATAAPIGRPFRLTLQQWLAWKGLLDSDHNEEEQEVVAALSRTLQKEEVQVDDLRSDQSADVSGSAAAKLQAASSALVLQAEDRVMAASPTRSHSNHDRPACPVPARGTAEDRWAALLARVRARQADAVVEGRSEGHLGACRRLPGALVQTV